MTDQGSDPERPVTNASGLESYREKWSALPARSRGLLAAAAAAALLVTGVAGGAAGAGLLRPAPQTFDVALVATPISQLGPDGRVAVDGKVVEIFGNKLVIDDGTARALIETGRAGEDGDLVANGEPITVQGRFERGFVHASTIRRANGEIEELAPPPPPGRPPHGHP